MPLPYLRVSASLVRGGCLECSGGYLCAGGGAVHGGRCKHAAQCPGAGQLRTKVVPRPLFRPAAVVVLATIHLGLDQATVRDISTGVASSKPACSTCDSAVGRIWCAPCRPACTCRRCVRTSPWLFVEAVPPLGTLDA